MRGWEINRLDIAIYESRIDRRGRGEESIREQMEWL
jgi:hypothetical protein